MPRERHRVCLPRERSRNKKGDAGGSFPMARLTEAHASTRSYARDGRHAAARRRLGAVRSALAAGGDEAATVLEVASEIAQTAGLSLSDEDGVWGEIYKEIGVTPVINATGSVTILGGSTPHPEVSAAMDKANSAFVPLWELQKAAGAAIAEMVGVPSAMVSSGCGGAMMLAAAAALAGDDVAAIEALPDTSSLAKDEFLIMARQRYKFDRCFEAAGAKLVDWGAATGPISIDEMVAAIGPRTCAVVYVANENHADPYPYDYSKGPLPDLQGLIDAAHAHGLYVGSPKLTVVFSHSSYILMTYRVFGRSSWTRRARSTP